MTQPTPDQIHEAWETVNYALVLGHINQQDHAAITAALPPQPPTYEELAAQVQELQAKLGIIRNLDTDPLPLPKPADCKPGEWHLIRDSDGYILPMQRDATMKHCPWTCGDWGAEDHEIEILARLIPDREWTEVQE